MEENSAKVSIDKAKRSKGLFPRLSLKKTLELSQKIYELGNGDPIPRLVVFDKLNKSADSGPSRMLVTTSNSYGLTTGSYSAERLGITDKGREYFQTSDENRKNSIAIQLLLNNELFSKFYEKYKNKALPDTAVAIDFLKQNGLGELEAKTAYDVFYENFNDYGFIQQLSGKSAIMPPEIVNEEGTEENHTFVETIANANTNEVPKVSEKRISSRLGAMPQFNFNIQVQLPENATPETYDAIFKSISEHLLKSQDED